MEIFGVTPMDAVSYVSNTKDFPIEEFKAFCKKNHLRMGQAWMNALSRNESEALMNSVWDPYETDHWAFILAATVYLIDPNVDRDELNGAIQTCLQSSNHTN